MQSSLKVCKNSSLKYVEVHSCVNIALHSLWKAINTHYNSLQPWIHRSKNLYTFLLSPKSSMSSLWKSIYSWPCHLMHWHFWPLKNYMPLHRIIIHFESAFCKTASVISYWIIWATCQRLNFILVSFLILLYLIYFYRRGLFLRLSFVIHLCNYIFNVSLHISFSPSLLFILRSTL